ncbi:MAG: FHA domain-containing protein [Planctomycetota bacterium]
MAELVIIGPDGSRTPLTIEGTDRVLGRDPQADIHVDDSRISRRHARVGWRLVIEDLQSTNGLYYGAERVQSRILMPGDRVGLGAEDRCLIELVGEPALSAASTSPTSLADTTEPPDDPLVPKLESRLRAAQSRILELEQALARAEKAAERPSPEPKPEPKQPEPEPERPREAPVELEPSPSSAAGESEILRLKRSVLGLTRERDELGKKLKERERRLTVLERDNWRLRTAGGHEGSGDVAALVHEVESLRSALQERDAALAVAAAETSEAEASAPDALQRKLADREARLASLQKELASVRSAVSSGQKSASPNRGFIADLAQCLLEGGAVSTLRPGVETDIAKIVRGLQTFTTRVEKKLLSTARARGFGEAWKLAGHPSLVEHHSDVIRSGNQEAISLLAGHLQRLEGLITAALHAPDEAFAAWLDENWIALSPRSLRKAAGLELDGELSAEQQRVLWQAYEIQVRRLDTDHLRERFRHQLGEEMSRV